MSQTTELHYLLPGEWWSLDVTGEPTAVERRIRTLVATAVGQRDEFAQARHDLRVKLQDVAERSRKVKASKVHIARKLLGPVPLPATLTISRPGAAIPHAGTVEATAQALLSLVPGSETNTLEHASLAVARSVIRHVVEPATACAPSLVVNYWIATPATTTLTVFTFSTPLLDLADSLLPFFDAIVLNVRPAGSAALPPEQTLDESHAI